MKPNPATPRKRLLLPLLAIGALMCLLAACSGAKGPSGPPEKQYRLSGAIEALDPKLQTATVNAAAIPGWMEAMTMEFPIRSKSDFEKLHVGDRITATVNVRGTDYALTNIHRQSANH
jgi:Cu(I)/Ag(I) efflux system protein CusF